MKKYMIKEEWVGYGINRYVFNAHELMFFDLFKTEVSNTYAYTYQECYDKLLKEIERLKENKKHKLYKKIIELE